MRSSLGSSSSSGLIFSEEEIALLLLKVEQWIYLV